MICYFWEGLKPSMKVEIEQYDWESIDFEEMIQKAVNVEAKVGLRSSTIVWDLNACCPRGHRLFHNTCFKIQTQSSKNFSCSKETKSKDPKLALSYDDAAEPAKKKDKKDKKKKLQNRRQEHNKQTLATGGNSEAQKKKKRGMTQARSRVLIAIRKDITPMTTPSFQKTSVDLGKLRAGD